jgi:hypothetical protein
MKASEVGKFYDPLNDASRGRFRALHHLCETEGWDLNLWVQTHLDGLSDKEMKLYFQATEKDRTKLFFYVTLADTESQILGWNLYLQDKISSARNSLTSAEAKILLAESA